MPAQVRYRPSSKGARALLNSPEMMSGLQGVVNGIRDSAYGGTHQLRSLGSPLYVADVQAGRRRAHAMVKTANLAAAIDNARRNTLLKALGGARA